MMESSSILERLISVILEHELHDDDEKTALHFAAEEDDIEMAKLLIEAGADVDVTDDDEKTPLHIAAENNSIEVVRLLVNAGANIETEDDDNKTALQLAKDKGFSEITSIIEAGGNSSKMKNQIDIREQKNSVSLHIKNPTGNLADVLAKALTTANELGTKSKEGNLDKETAISTFRNNYDIKP